MEEFITEKEKNTIAYKACVVSQTLLGVAVGSIPTAGVGAPLGFAAGLLFGVLTCPMLTPSVKKKLFGADTSYDKDEIEQMVSALKGVRKGMSKNDALNVIYNANNTISSNQALFKIS